MNPFKVLVDGQYLLDRLDPNEKTSGPSSQAPTSSYEVEEKKEQGGSDHSYGSEHSHESETHEESRSPHSIWKHLTISRNKTSAADNTRELLLVLARGAQWRDTESSRHDYTFDVTKPTFTRHFRLTKLVPDHTFKIHQPPTIVEYPTSQKRDPIMQTTDQPNLPSARAGKSQHQSIHALDPRLGSRSRIGDSQSRPEDPDFPTAPQSLLSQGTASGQTPSILDSGLYDEMRRQIDSLEQEIRNLKETSKDNPAWKAVYFIEFDASRPASAFLDEPSWSIGSNGKPILIAHLPIADIGGFLRQRQEIAFVVSKYYSPGMQYPEAVKASIARTPLPATQAFKEVITFNSQNMIDAVESFFALQPMFKEEFPDFNVRAHIAAPYLFWYHYRSPVALDNLGSLHRPLMQSLTDWIEEHYQALYTRVESQMEKGVISQETMPFLVKPGDILVWENKNKFEAVIARSWSRCESLYKSSKPQGTSWEINPAIDAEKASSVWVVDGWQYSYDGRFLESDEVIKMRFKKVTMAHEVEINKLSAYPLRYASEHLKAVLERRGQTFWKCRRRHIVSYSDVSGFYGVSTITAMLTLLIHY